MRKAFVVKNLWDYEEVNPIPERLPQDMDTFYITDSYINCYLAGDQGWHNAICVRDYLNITDKLQRRSLIGAINCYPERFCPELNEYDKVFVCDSNILILPSTYKDFIDQSEDQACYLTSGYYKGTEDNIFQELSRSVNSRWNYNGDAMVKATEEYLKEMVLLDIDYKRISVSSAKYIGWNLRNPKRKQIADFVLQEYQKHLQGNIIFTFVSAKWEDDVLNFQNLSDDVSFSPHKYTA